ncbi:ChbG/HpnK family deacetylase [Mucilaginibacter sp. HMF5004]|uniref:carbohydrate deacetylase n=1 Tax=Mucilaginibacter rivuli TaxID=2857527 RepID=UPI001C5D47A5|nr:ChbG/HpnK family deacetylase [Mucilaginibacter rivuli]MBW4891103.1 ChbG/HpnK family deacetylase [Mucilaginibacter rivuli]
MQIPENLIVNADDFGLKTSVNKAILYCYEHGYINSTSLMATAGTEINFAFDEAVEMIHANTSIQNVGVHINLDDGKPLTNFKNKRYLTANGHWDKSTTSKKVKFLDTQTKNDFRAEIEAQVLKVVNSKVKITHIDSHHHLHTLPGFYEIFLDAAQRHKVKLRLAQTYNEGSYIKFLFRRYINRKITNSGCNYSDQFETIDYFLSNKIPRKDKGATELMLHPDFDISGQLTDHYSATDMSGWVNYLKGLNNA